MEAAPAASASGHAVLLQRLAAVAEGPSEAEVSMVVADLELLLEASEEAAALPRAVVASGVDAQAAGLVHALEVPSAASVEAAATDPLRSPLVAPLVASWEVAAMLVWTIVELSAASSVAPWEALKVVARAMCPSRVGLCAEERLVQPLAASSVGAAMVLSRIAPRALVAMVAVSALDTGAASLVELVLGVAPTVVDVAVVVVVALGHPLAVTVEEEFPLAVTVEGELPLVVISVGSVCYCLSLQSR